MDFGNGQFEGMQFATAQRDGLKEASGSHCGVESQGLRVLVDDRERASGVIEALAGMSGISVQVQRLVLGDYLVGGNLIFERKTLRDFGVSLIDGRLFRQAVLLAKGKRRPVMILEGVETGGGSNPISQEALTGAMITLSLQFGISILRSHDAAETAKIIVMAAKQADRFASGVHPRPGYRPKGFYRRRLFILQGLPGLGPEKARKILAHFGTIAKIFAASEMELREVPGIGKKIAYGFKRIVQEESEQYPNQNSSPKEVNKIKSKPSQDPTIFSRCLPEKKLT
jgi:ERCC4-type nuclease